MTLPIEVVDHREPFTCEWLETLEGVRILACDFPVSGAEAAQPVPGGYCFGRVVNIDHHADTKDMRRIVSSANLALHRLETLGPEPFGSRVIISHADCDSVLSSGIVSGALSPDPMLGDAAIAADHTGEQNVVADLLQELENIRGAARSEAVDTQRDLPYCFDLVRRLAADGERTLDERAKFALAERRRKRAAAAAFVARKGGDGITLSGGLAIGCPSQELDGELFPALMPDAIVILLMKRRTDRPARWDAKVRLGLAAPPGSDLRQLGITTFDPRFAGRWNAGSNRRNGGTDVDPLKYAHHLIQRLPQLGTEAGTRAPFNADMNSKR